MKKVILFFIISLFFTLGIHASQSILTLQQDSTEEYECLFKGKVKHGWYVGFGNYYQKINKKDASSFHFTGAWVIDRKVAIGFTGYGFSSDNGRLVFKDSTEKDVFIDGGCGGLIIEPIIMSNKRVHITMPILIGAGGFVLNTSDDLNYASTNSSSTSKNKKLDQSSAFILEPGLEIEFNVFKFMKIGIGGKYRHTSDLALKGFSKDIFKGFSFGWNIKFGKY